MDFAIHYAINPIRFMIRPELNVVQDTGHGSSEPKVVQGAHLKEIL